MHAVRRDAGAKAPAAQDSQSVKPPLAEKVPAAQGLHPSALLSPIMPPNVPAGQARMRFPPPQYAPRGHTAHCPETHVVRPASGAVLGGHGGQPVPAHAVVQ
jgi:hypothetical protein